MDTVVDTVVDTNLCNILIASLIIVVIIIIIKYLKSDSAESDSTEHFANYPDKGNCLLSNLKNLNQIKSTFDSLLDKYFHALSQYREWFMKNDINNIDTIDQNAQYESVVLKFLDMILALANLTFGNNWMNELIRDNFLIAKNLFQAIKFNDLSKKYLFQRRFSENSQQIGRALDFFLGCCKVEYSFDARFQLCDRKRYLHKMQQYAVPYMN